MARASLRSTQATGADGMTGLDTGMGIQQLTVGIADCFWHHLRGLMFAYPLEPMSALLLTRCASIHTAFMRQTIDVLYLDAHGVVLRCVANIPRGAPVPGRAQNMCWKWPPAASHV